MTDFLTGDHAEINAVTRAKREERQKIFSNLPQKTQELLVPKPTFFMAYLIRLKIGFKRPKILQFSTTWN